MESSIEVADTLQQNISLEREMIGRDNHGAILELVKQGTPKKAIARMLARRRHAGRARGIRGCR